MRVSSLLLFVLLSLAALGQNDRIFVEEGDKIFDFGDYEDAILFYQLAIEENPNNIRAHYMTGSCFLITTSEKEEAAYYLEKAHALDPEVANDVLFKIGEGYRYRYEFEKAIGFYNQFINEIDVNTRAFEGEDTNSLIKKADRRIEECKNAINYVSHPVNFKAINLGTQVNSISEDYAPTLNRDETMLFLTSKREGSTGGLKDTDNKYFEDIWVAQKQGEKWSEPTNLGTKINTNQHESNIGLSPDDKTLFIYHTDNSGDIYFSDYKDGEWQDVKPLDDDVNTAYQETSICISANDNFMFFTSSRPGGEGDLDIYVRRRLKKNKWSKPVNLGGVINTEYAEEGPYFDQENSTLYFSSKGHDGMGGYDLYKSSWYTISNTFTPAENLGYPINSVDDELFFTISAVTGSPYFASFKGDSRGYQDLYMIVPSNERVHEIVDEQHLEEDIMDELDTAFATNHLPQRYEFRVKDASTGTIIKDAIVKVHFLQDDKNIMKPSDQGTASYVFSDEKLTEYVLLADAKGYIFKSKNIHIKPSTENKPVQVVEIFLVKEAVLVPTVLSNVYFQFDQATLNENYAVELDHLATMLKENLAMTIEIAGHTDYAGTEIYNNSLSLKRANAIKMYLLQNGISEKRIVAKGYGEKYPLASNDDEAEGRALNRRSEFIILTK